MMSMIPNDNYNDIYICSIPLKTHKLNASFDHRSALLKSRRAEASVLMLRLCKTNHFIQSAVQSHPAAWTPGRRKRPRGKLPSLPWEANREGAVQHISYGCLMRLRIHSWTAPWFMVPWDDFKLFLVLTCHMSRNILSLPLSPSPPDQVCNMLRLGNYPVIHQESGKWNNGNLRSNVTKCILIIWVYWTLSMRVANTQSRILRVVYPCFLESLKWNAGF